ncbi:carbohydrate ABC transporter permease [Paenibacillus hexagrammi]|uniref:Sugar ABC transporter permease n=1 Tax=Paenibacillus hexagrammi TaxID=2908839 RepID=A0ABY3SG97_9BACL|nr:sugar ABC transporter permease [Paenibacillus sp. YPD9-1]UJF32465.1 sugar ABC transporter permease [Paenibacillus sp. YPD9-1]
MTTASKRWRELGVFITFVAPVLVLILLSAEIPFIMSLYYSLTKWNGISKHITFIGLQNFKELFLTDTDALASFFFTLRYSVATIVATNVIALLLAVVLTKTFKLTSILRAAFFVPYIVSLVIIGFIWKFVFSNAFSSLYEWTHWPLFQWSWLGTADLAFISVVFVSVWQSVGFYMMIYITGLQSIPGELNEAAAIDGANGFNRFFRITLPLLMPSLTVALFLSISNSLKVFDIIFTLTFGGPGKTTTSSTMDIYNEAFVNNRFGYATAKSLMFVVLILLITLIQVKFFKSKEVEA